jgi:hypothetical protein
VSLFLFQLNSYRQSKTGVRGMGFARTDTSVPWLQDLAVKLPK